MHPPRQIISPVSAAQKRFTNTFFEELQLLIVHGKRCSGQLLSVTRQVHRTSLSESAALPHPSPEPRGHRDAGRDACATLATNGIRAGRVCYVARKRPERPWRNCTTEDYYFCIFAFLLLTLILLSLLGAFGHARLPAPLLQRASRYHFSLRHLRLHCKLLALYVQLIHTLGPIARIPAQIQGEQYPGPSPARLSIPVWPGPNQISILCVRNGR